MKSKELLYGIKMLFNYYVNDTHNNDFAIIEKDLDLLEQFKEAFKNIDVKVSKEKIDVNNFDAIILKKVLERLNNNG